LTAQARGEIELEGGVLVIRRIHVELRLRAPADARETVERVHGVFARKCPVYVSLHRAIDITTSWRIEVE
jgi:uncharacterized OsmC-like protein